VCSLADDLAHDDDVGHTHTTDAAAAPPGSLLDAAFTAAVAGGPRGTSKLGQDLPPAEGLAPVIAEAVCTAAENQTQVLDAAEDMLADTHRLLARLDPAVDPTAATPGSTQASAASAGLPPPLVPLAEPVVTAASLPAIPTRLSRGAGPPAQPPASQQGSSSGTLRGAAPLALCLEVLPLTPPHRAPHPYLDPLLAAALHLRRKRPDTADQFDDFYGVIVSMEAVAAELGARGDDSLASRGIPASLFPRIIACLGVPELLAAETVLKTAFSPGMAAGNTRVTLAASERDLFQTLRAFVLRSDPDLLLAYELQRASWGFVCERWAWLHPRDFSFETYLSRRHPAHYPRGGRRSQLHKYAHSVGVVRAENQPGTAGPTRKMNGPQAPDLPLKTHHRAVQGLFVQGDETAVASTANEGGDIRVEGRQVFNVWRLLRVEVKIASSSASAAAEHILGITLPAHSMGALATELMRSLCAATTEAAVEGNGGLPVPRPSGSSPPLFAPLHLLALCAATHGVLSKLEFLERSMQMARVGGVRMYDVMHRGSQLRVEAMLMRVARARGMLAMSMSPSQVASQPGLESQPLNMEPPPHSYFTDPVVVLDFRSLYPSIAIAYNMCYSTCIGKVDAGVAGRPPAEATEASGGSKLFYNPLLPFGRASRARAGPTDMFGPAVLPPQPSEAVRLAGYSTSRDWALVQRLHAAGSLTVTSTGVGFVRRDVREGLLPRMLAEILQTRFAVKAAMKQAHVREGTARQRQAEALQSARKLRSRIRRTQSSASTMPPPQTPTQSSAPCTPQHAAPSTQSTPQSVRARRPKSSKVPSAAALQQHYHSLQLALKLIANVSYGYAAASFTGRFPCQVRTIDLLLMLFTYYMLLIYSSLPRSSPTRSCRWRATLSSMPSAPSPRTRAGPPRWSTATPTRSSCYCAAAPWRRPSPWAARSRWR
jgi:DNA polymerase elongation subunit (family B)